MGTELREYQGETIALSRTLVWTDLIADPNEPGRFVMDPATGRRWKRLTTEQETIAQEIVRGANYREACKAAGMKAKPETASGYVVYKLANHAPFINRVIELLTEARQSQSVTVESHLKRLDDLGRRAEKAGKYSASIAAEVARGRAAGLYAKDIDPEDKKALASIQDIDSRIKQLLGKMNSQEKEAQGRVIEDQGGKSED